MVKKARTPSRRDEALSREQIIDAAIELLDASGEAGLTFRALSGRLATGPGAIYGHIADKSDLLTAACDVLVARALDEAPRCAAPDAAIRALALALFDAIDAHPWIGSALAVAPGQLPMVRILDRVGRQVRALGVPDAAQWRATSALLSYILGVGGQNAANGQLAREQRLDRTNFLDSMAATWAMLDPAEYPFAHAIAAQMREHDDRADFLAGIDLLLGGLAAARRKR